LETEDIVSSRIDNEIRAWIEQHVEIHMDWKGMKSLLRFSEEQMDD
jgi:hypothetical protein